MKICPGCFQIIADKDKEKCPWCGHELTVDNVPLKGLKALFRRPNEDGSVNGKGSIPWGCLFENFGLLFYLIVLLVIAISAAIGMGLHNLASERARQKLPEGCPPRCASAQLAGVNLREAELEHADLSEADMSGANLAGAILKRANLGKANLSAAGLAEADLANANLRGANLPRPTLLAPTCGGPIYVRPICARLVFRRPFWLEPTCAAPTYAAPICARSVCGEPTSETASSTIQHSGKQQRTNPMLALSGRSSTRGLKAVSCRE